LVQPHELRASHALRRRGSQRQSSQDNLDFPSVIFLNNLQILLVAFLPHLAERLRENGSARLVEGEFQG